MSDIADKIERIKSEISSKNVKLVAVSKTKPVELIREAYQAGQRIFGENKVQELVMKQEVLSKDIQWHMIGHLQRNKVKYIAPFVHLIHGVDTFKLLKEIDKEARKNNRVINCLIQVHIAQESTKFGFDEEEVLALLNSSELSALNNISIKGLMGMATNTPEYSLVSEEFAGLKNLFQKIKTSFHIHNLDMEELSMGMSGDYKIAINNGSTLVRIGSTIFGKRN